MPRQYTVRLQDLQPVNVPASELTPVSAPEAEATAPPQEPGLLDQVMGAHGLLTRATNQAGIGALKGVGRTAIGLGRLFHQIPGLKQIGDAIQPGAFEGTQAETALGLDPTNPMQSAGMTLEQIGEFLLPASKLPAMSTLPRAAAEAATAYGVSKAQGDPSADVSAALAGAGPIVGKAIGKVAAPIAARLDKSAKQNIGEALNATRHRTKVKAARITPEIQKRRLVGTVDELKDEAKLRTGELGEQIDLTLARNRDREVALQPVREALLREKATTSNLVKTPEGVSKEVVHDPRKRAQVEKIESILNEYGDTMTTEQAVALRRTWDDVVARAGGFDEKATREFGVSLDDASEAGVLRPVTGALRKQLAEANPDIRALNQEFKFWRDLQDVTQATSSRRVGQRGRGLMAKTAGAGGRAAGAVIGSVGGPASAAGGALLAGELAERANTLFTSTKWKLVSAREKTRLAEALASGNQERIGTALGRIGAAIGPQPLPAH